VQIEEIPMVTCLVIEIVGTEKNGLGARTFESIPRVGEWISLSVDESAVMFEVRQIAHAEGYVEGSHTNGADIYVTRVGSEMEAISSLRP
jgi:hypothetical protein